MIEGNMLIIAVGPVECGLCPAKLDDDGHAVTREGLVLEVDGSELPFCWKHVRAFTNLKRNAKPKAKPITPEFPAMKNGS